MTVGWIDGAQAQGVLATVKHFAANNMEGEDPTGQAGNPGSPLGAGVIGSRYVENSIVDDRTLHEVYFPQFEAAVKEAHSAIVMCSYNLLNGTYACENPHLLQDVLERQWGFQGYVLADYGAAHNTIASLNGGLDFEPWPGWAYAPAEVDAALATGQVSPATIDAHIHRILRTLFAYDFFDRPAYVNSDAQIDQAAHAATAQRIEESAVTLLTNHGLLPLDAHRLHSIAVIGKPATSFVTGGGSGNVTPFSYSDPLDAIKQRAGPGVKVTYDDGSDPAQAATDAHNADVALVFADDYYTEGADRNCLTLECPNQGDQDGLIQQVETAQPNTAVVLESGGADLTPWRDQVKALVEAWYPGERGGPAIARVLFGDADPGGRLPVTFPRQEADLPTAGDPQKYPGVANQVTYKEGVFVGYRWYDQHGLQPAFPFGFGLSYTTFRYSNLRVSPAPAGSTAVVDVRLTVTNAGARTGWAVPQLYLGLPSTAALAEPVRELAGFAKVSLAPGRSTTVTLPLDQRAFSYWDSATQDWRVAPGCDQVAVGSSSRDVLLSGVIAQGGAGCPHAVAGCRISRDLRIAIPQNHGAPVRVTIYVGRRRVKLVRGRRISHVTIRRPSGSSFTVRVVVLTARGFTVTSVRRYRACTATRARTRVRRHARSR